MKSSLTLTFSYSVSSLYWYYLSLVIVVLFLTSVVFSSNLIQTAKAIKPYQNLQPVPIQLTASDQNLTGNTTLDFTEFIGFDKDFSLQYPSDWTVQPKTSKFEKVDVTLLKYQEGIMTVEYAPLSSYAIQIMKEEHAKQKDIENLLDSLFPTYLQTFTNTFTNGGGYASEVEEPLYNKYKVNGHKAGSSLLAIQTNNSQKFGALVVFSIIGKNSFVFSYTAPEQIFDQNLSVAEEVLGSVQILPKLAS